MNLEAVEWVLVVQHVAVALLTKENVVPHISRLRTVFIIASTTSVMLLKADMKV